MKVNRADIAKGARLLKSFAGGKPSVVGKLEFPKNPGAAIVIGELLGLSYKTTRDNVTDNYYHEFKLQQNRPLLVSSPDGKQLFILGGGYNFTERGIVDKKP